MGRVQPTKAELRAEILASRRAVLAEVRAAETAALSGHLAAIARSGETLCAYAPVGSEPGSLSMLDAVRALGVTVLLPVAREDAAGTPLPLRWGEYRGTLVDARFGLREPPEPWLPPDGIAGASIVVVPALAVDLAGVRLGRGAGFYDRTLGLADPSARLVAMVRDDELRDWLPGEPHDVAMTDVLTPTQGLVGLGGRGPARGE